MNEENYILSYEAAESVLKKVFDYYEIDIDDIEDKEYKKVMNMSYRRAIKAVRLGRLEVKFDKGIEIIQHLKGNDTTISYREIDAIAKRSMAQYENTDTYGRMYGVLGSLSNLGEAGIQKLKGVDLSLAEVLGAIFLSV